METAVHACCRSIACSKEVNLASLPVSVYSILECCSFTGLMRSRECARHWRRRKDACRGVCCRWSTTWSRSWPRVRIGCIGRTSGRYLSSSAERSVLMSCVVGVIMTGGYLHSVTYAQLAPGLFSFLFAAWSEALRSLGQALENENSAASVLRDASSVEGLGIISLVAGTQSLSRRSLTLKSCVEYANCTCILSVL